jgi:ribonuclease BN (tRNA processing enzyme)
VLMTDVELLASTPEDRARYRALADEADVVIVDAQYRREDMANTTTWGHSYIGDFVECFRDLDIRRLCLFHYDPAYTDEDITRLTDEARAKAEALSPKPKFEIIAAYEGLEIDL